MENLEIIIHPRIFSLVFLLPHFRVPIDLDTQIIPGLLPVYLTVGNIKNVLVPDLNPVGNLQQNDARGNVLRLGHPIRDHVVRRRPVEVANSGDFQGLFVQKAERGRLVYREDVVADARKVLVVLGPAEDGPRGGALWVEGALFQAGPGWQNAEKLF